MHLQCIRSPQTMTVPVSAYIWKRLGITLSLISSLCGLTSVVWTAAQSPTDMARVMTSACTTLSGIIILILWLRRSLPPAIASQPVPDTTVMPEADVVTRKPHGGDSWPAAHEITKSQNAPSRAVEGGRRPPIRLQPTMAPSGPLFTEEELRLASQRERMVIRHDLFQTNPLFTLDPPTEGVHAFTLSKESDGLCADGYALQPKYQSYAVTDGVTRSFMSAPWARIVARSFVTRCGRFQVPFQDKGQFSKWLETCSAEWHDWIMQTWVPVINSQRRQYGEPPGDWSKGIAQGAATTLVGCTLQRVRGMRAVGTEIRVFAIGDSEFFLFRPDSALGLKLEYAFPFTSPNEFSDQTIALQTRMDPELVDESWVQRKIDKLSAEPGDLIVLASDSLAKWLLTQVLLARAANVALLASESVRKWLLKQQAQEDANEWRVLLGNTDSQVFEEIVRSEQTSGRMDHDDVTMLIIPVL